MKEFIMIFRNASAENGYLAKPEDMAAEMPLWQAWIGSIALQGKLISTAPVQYDATVIHHNGEITNTPHKEANTVLVSGYLICRAENLEEAQSWAKDCPILKYPESSVEIRPLIQFPLN